MIIPFTSNEEWQVLTLAHWLRKGDRQQAIQLVQKMAEATIKAIEDGLHVKKVTTTLQDSIAGIYFAVDVSEPAAVLTLQNNPFAGGNNISANICLEMDCCHVEFKDLDYGYVSFKHLNNVNVNKCTLFQTHTKLENLKVSDLSRWYLS